MTPRTGRSSQGKSRRVGRLGGASTSVTIREVARRADVSVATVSRVFSGKGPVRDDTAKRVRVVAQELRYVPHVAAQSLITRRTDTIGVLLPDIYGEFFSELIRGIDQAARHHALHLLVASGRSDEREVAAVLHAMRGRVDGLIVMSPEVKAKAIESSLPRDAAAVLLDCPSDGTTFRSLRIDNSGGAAAMVRHLAGLGHRRIAMIQGPQGNFDARERRRGYRGARGRLGLDTDAGLEFAGDFSEEAGGRAARQLMSLRRPPSAIFAANDAMAIGCLLALAELGVAVPETVAVGGFDDIPIARFTAPPLTSVRVPIAAMGHLAVQRLLAAMRGDDDGAAQDATLATTLVVRRSCGAPSETSSATGTTGTAGPLAPPLSKRRGL